MVLDKEIDLLVHRLINKDKAAFDTVYSTYFTRLVSYAYRFLDSREEAEEVVQDTFVKFWDKCDTLQPNSSIKNYLYRAVHNTTLNILKHNKVKDLYRDHIVKQMEESYDPENVTVEEEDLMTRLAKALDFLPPRCREVFELSRFEGLKYTEIAEHLNISIKTVEVQMGKALKILRQKLK